MVPKSPSQKWKVVFLTPGSPIERKFRSQTAAFTAVNGERELIVEEVSRVSRAVVYQWDPSNGRWMTFERIDLKAEAEVTRAARKAKAEKEHLSQQLEAVKDET